MSRRSRKEVEAIVSAMGIFMTIISSLVELVKQLGGSMEKIYRLATPEGSKTLEAIASLIVGGAERAQSEFLRLISGGKNLVLDAADGKEILSDANDLFAYIDSDFRNWKADEPGQSTGETPVSVYEMTKDATFSQMFGSLATDVSQLCFSQSQIKGFVKKFRSWLRDDGYATLFLFQSHGEFFVARVNVYSDGLLVFVYRLEDSFVWGAGDRHRVVVPQLV